MADAPLKSTSLTTTRSDEAADVVLRIPRQKPSTLHYFASATRRSVREAFSKESLLSSLKSFFWVAPLTVLIWIYAEREQLITVKAFAIPVEVKSSDPRQTVTILSPASRMIEADLRGPRARLDRVRDEFAARGEEPARIEIDRNIGLGRQLISAERVETDPAFVENGVSLSNMQPRLIEIFVDQLEDVQAEVRLPEEVTNVSRATFEPAQVGVTAPRSVLEELPRPLVVYADPTSIAQLNTPGAHKAVNVRLTTPARDRGVRLTTASVKADIEVRPADVEYKIDAMPIDIAYPQDMEDAYRAELSEPSIANVTVVGRPEAIRRLRDPEFTPKPYALLRVTGDDLPVGTTRSRTPIFMLPDGVKVKPGDAKRTVEFRLVEREATAQ